jgi:putative ATP-binding cassette transporter
LIRDLSLSVDEGKSLLITGPNVTAKCALFLAAAGLWKDGEGRIVRPPADEICFVHERPLITSGTLRDQLLLAAPKRTFRDEELLSVLRQVGLESLVARYGGLDAERDWSAAFSVGEQHLLSFARLFLARPRFAFLDRVGNSLDPERVGPLYRQLADSAISYLSIGAERTLLAYHDSILEITEEGRGRISPARETSAA